MKDLNKEQLLRIYRTADDDELSCYQITPILIAGRELNEHQNDYVMMLDDLLSKETIESPLSVYRVCGANFIEQIRDFGGRYLSYVSTSSTFGEVLSFTKDYEKCGAILLKINIPKGANAVRVSSDEVENIENEEYLLPRNTRFEVVQDTLELEFEDEFLIGARGCNFSAMYELNVMID